MNDEKGMMNVSVPESFHHQQEEIGAADLREGKEKIDLIDKTVVTSVKGKMLYMVIIITYNKDEEGEDSMTFSINLNDEEKKLAESYAKLHSMSVGEAFKKALFDKIEDEYDAAVAEEAYNEYVKTGKQSRPIGELWKELDL